MRGTGREALRTHRGLTDNKQRTVSEIRTPVKTRGKLRGSWVRSMDISAKGYLLVDKSKVDEDTLMTIALDAVRRT